MYSLKVTYLLISIVSIVLLIIANDQPANAQLAINFSSAYTLIPLIGGVLGLLKFWLFSNRKEYSKTYIIAGTLFSLGIISWAIGSIFWIYYYLNKFSEPPYPSIADVFYSLHGISWMIGIFIILRELKADLLSDLHKISPYILLLLVNSYFLLFQGNKVEDVLKNGNTSEFANYLLNMLYTLVDIANICLLLICVFGRAFTKLSSEMRISLILIAIGLFINYIANLIFGIQQSLTYQHPIAKYIGGFVDYLYAIEFVLLSMAILNMPLQTKLLQPSCMGTMGEKE